MRDAYQALDALYVASDITLEDGTNVNVIQTLMSDPRELSLVETNGESIFAGSRDYRGFDKNGEYKEPSSEVIGTIHFNRKNGVVFDDTKNINSKTELYNSDGSLKPNAKVNSPTSILGHEAVHALNYITDRNLQNTNRESGPVTFGRIKFKNQEEARTTTLSSQINIRLKENPRMSHKGDYKQTTGVLSNKVKIE